jgi:hypothetical protein
MQAVTSVIEGGIGVPISGCGYTAAGDKTPR